MNLMMETQISQQGKHSITDVDKFLIELTVGAIGKANIVVDD